MGIYWGVKSIPELADLPQDERKVAWQACRWKVLRHWQSWIGLLTCGLCVAIGHIIGGYIHGNDIWGRVVCSAIGGGIGGFIYGQVAIGQARPYLREYLKDR